MNEIIIFDNVYKVYKLYEKDRDRLRSFITRKDKCIKKVASNYLTFNVKKGERIAFIGPNGAGKSTILKLITKVCHPTEGIVTVKGRVAALLELSAGFDPEFTGRENIYLKCYLLGLNKKEVSLIEEEIINFADIGKYIDQPIRTYSSGMKARLGFSIIIHSNADIIVVDEALSVGDKNFRLKCFNKIKEISESKEVTMLFVTHSMQQAKDFCTRGILLNKGHLVYDGNIEDTIAEYEKHF